MANAIALTMNHDLRILAGCREFQTHLHPIPHPERKTTNLPKPQPRRRTIDHGKPANPGVPVGTVANSHPPPAAGKKKTNTSFQPQIPNCSARAAASPPLAMLSQIRHGSSAPRTLLHDLNFPHLRILKRFPTQVQQILQYRHRQIHAPRTSPRRKPNVPSNPTRSPISHILRST